MTGLAQLFPGKANGSLLWMDFGSSLIGQQFDSTIYFGHDLQQSITTDTVGCMELATR
jgi:K+-transporting ATPase c subunit